MSQSLENPLVNSIDLNDSRDSPIQLNQLKQNGYDPDQFPPDIHQAMQHGQANQVGILNFSTDQAKKACICCGFEMEVNQAPICGPKKQFLYLGLGFPLFFQFVEWCGYFMLYGMVFYGIFGMVIHETGTSCVTQTYFESAFSVCATENTTVLQDDTTQFICQYAYGQKNFDCSDKTSYCSLKPSICIKDAYNQFYFPNIQFNNGKRIAQSAVSMVFVGLLVVILQCLRYYSRKFYVTLDQDEIQPNDFTIMIRGLPQNQYTEKELVDYIYQWGLNNDLQGQLQIAQVSIAFDLHDFSLLCQKKSKLVLQKRKIDVYKQKNNDQFPKKWDQVKYDQLDADIKQLQQQILAQEFCTVKEKAQPSEIAFVSFQTTQMLEDVLERSETNFISRFCFQFAECCGVHTRLMIFKGKLLQIERAPDPTDIIWQNCGFTQDQKNKQRIISHLLTFVALLVVFIIQVSIQYGSAKLVLDILENNNIKDLWATIISFAFSMFVVVADSAICLILYQLVVMEKYATQTHFTLSMASSLSIAFFLNTAILTFVSGALVTYYVSDIKNGSFLRVSIQKIGGVQDEVFFISLSYIFSTCAELLFYPAFFMRIAMRWYVKRQGHDSMMTQAEANSWFEGCPILMYELYSYVILGMWYTCFYAPLVPDLFAIIALGFLMFYWIEKYYFCRRYGRPPQLGEDLNRQMVDLLDFCPLFFALGQFGLDVVFETQTAAIYVLDFISLGIGVASIILPMGALNKKFFRLEEEEVPQLAITFEQARSKFLTNYDLTNPLTKDAALAAQFEKLQQENQTKAQQLVMKNYYNQNDMVLQYRKESEVKNDPYYWQGQAPPNNNQGPTVELITTK